MTHIANVQHILLHGIVHRNSLNANAAYVPIGDASLIATRDSFQLDNGKRLGDYLPFYFGTRMPMLYVIERGFNGLTPIASQDIVYVITSVEQIIHAGLDFVFTDGHAVDSLTIQYSNIHIHHLDNLLDWKAINETSWKSDTDLDVKRRKQAEFLVLGDIPRQAVLAFGCYNEAANRNLQGMGVTPEKIHINKKHYFAV